MSDQTKENAIQKMEEPKAEQLSPTILQAKDIARRLKYMIVNGRRLSEQEVFALAQYAAANKLNPFAGECYYIENIGPVAGIAGWRSKANEELEYEARIAKVPGAHFWLTKRKATREEANFSEGEDVAYVVELRDSLSQARWRLALFDAARQLKELGLKDPYEEAKKLVGPEPVWDGIGIVFADERFGKEGRAEKYPREERAMKRAEKQALRKRFPRIDLPEPEGFEGDVVDAETTEYRTVMGDNNDLGQLSEGEKEEPQSHGTVDEISQQLGFPESA